MGMIKNRVLLSQMLMAFISKPHKYCKKTLDVFLRFMIKGRKAWLHEHPCIVRMFPFVELVNVKSYCLPIISENAFHMET